MNGFDTAALDLKALKEVGLGRRRDGQLSCSCNKAALGLYRFLELFLIKAWGTRPFIPFPCHPS